MVPNRLYDRSGAFFMNEIFYYIDTLNYYYALKDVSQNHNIFDGYIYINKKAKPIRLDSGSLLLLKKIEENKVLYTFLIELKKVGFIKQWDERTEPSFSKYKECNKSPDGKHHKGTTPLTNSRYEQWIICKFCGKDLEIIK